MSLLRWILSPNRDEQRAERERVKHESRAFGMLAVAGWLIGTPIMIIAAGSFAIEARLAVGLGIAISLAAPLIAGLLGRLLGRVLIPSWLGRPSWSATLSWLILAGFYALVIAHVK